MFGKLQSFKTLATNNYELYMYDVYIHEFFVFFCMENMFILHSISEI